LIKYADFHNPFLALSESFSDEDNRKCIT